MAFISCVYLSLILGYICAVQGHNFGFGHNVPFFPEPHHGFGFGTIKLKPIHVKTEVRMMDGSVHVFRPNKKGYGYGKKNHNGPQNHPFDSFRNDMKSFNFQHDNFKSFDSVDFNAFSKDNSNSFFKGNSNTYAKSSSNKGASINFPNSQDHGNPKGSFGKGGRTDISFPPDPHSGNPFDGFQGGHSDFNKGPVVQEGQPVDAGTIVIDVEGPKQGFNFNGLGFPGFTGNGLSFGGTFDGGKNLGGGLGKEITSLGKGSTGFGGGKDFGQNVNIGKPVDAGTVVIDANGPGLGGKGGPGKIDFGDKNTRPIEQDSKPVDAGTVVIDVGPDGQPIQPNGPIIQPILPIDTAVPVQPVVPIQPIGPIAANNGGRADIPIGFEGFQAVPDGVVPTFPAVAVQTNNFEQRFIGNAGLGVGGLGLGAPGFSQFGPGTGNIGIIDGGVGVQGLGVGGNSGFAGQTILNDATGLVVDPRLGVDIGPGLDPINIADDFGSRFGIPQPIGPTLTGNVLNNIDASVLTEIPNQSLNNVDTVVVPDTSAFVGTPDTIAPVGNVVDQNLLVNQNVLVDQNVIANQFGQGNQEVVRVIDNGAVGLDNRVENTILVDTGVNNGGVLIDQGALNTGNVGQVVTVNNQVLDQGLIAGPVVDIPTPIAGDGNSLVDLPLPIDDSNVVDIPPPSILENSVTRTATLVVDDKKTVINEKVL